MEAIRIQKIDGQEFVTLTDYLRLKEIAHDELKELKEAAKIAKELEEKNQKLKEEVKDLVERNIELNKKYMIVLTENNKLKKEFQQYKEHYNIEQDKQQIFLMTGRRY